jgi:hypothetical protein
MYFICKILANMTRVSDVAPGPLVILVMLRGRVSQAHLTRISCEKMIQIQY